MIAKTILEQLGGSQFVVLTGAKNFVALENGIQFSIPNRSGPNKIRITLTSEDLYNMEFFRLRGTKCTLVDEYTGVYFDQLIPIFENKTGLYAKF